jgi:ribose transport system ATP-binding protein
MVAIARGVSLGARVLVLDEPTSSLADREVALLYDVVRRLKASGVGVVYISHRFDELYAICDRVTVLRDGRRVDTRPLAGLARLDLVALMLGKSPDAVRAGGATGFGRRAADARLTRRPTARRRARRSSRPRASAAAPGCAA